MAGGFGVRPDLQVWRLEAEHGQDRTDLFAVHAPVVQSLGDRHERLRLVGALVEAQLVPRVERICEVLLPQPGGLIDSGFQLFEVADVALVAFRPRGTRDPGPRQVAGVRVDEVVER